jgi:hypothetical protein
MQQRLAAMSGHSPACLTRLIGARGWATVGRAVFHLGNVDWSRRVPHMKNTTSTAWNTSESLSNNSAMTRFITWATRETSLPIEDYTTLWDWSVAQPADFWTGLARFFDSEPGHR